MRTLLSPRRAGFTLIEMMVAVAILVLLVALLAQLLTSATSVTNTSKNRLNSDDQARLALDRIGQDLANMVKRSDVDYYLDKSKPNDQFFFYSEVPGVGADGITSSGVSLVGYHIQDEKLERYSRSMSWTDLPFMSYDTNGGLISGSAMRAQYEKISPADYHILCDGVFRLEFSFLLKNGNGIYYSAEPNLPSSGKNEVGQRMFADNHASICVLKTDTQTLYRGLGWQDVSAIVVTIAVLDNTSRVILNPGELESAVSNMSDASFPASGTSVTLPAEEWTKKINDGGLGINPKKAANAIRVYQRAFYLNTP